MKNRQTSRALCRVLLPAGPSLATAATRLLLPNRGVPRARSSLAALVGDAGGESLLGVDGLLKTSLNSSSSLDEESVGGGGEGGVPGWPCCSLCEDEDAE